MPDAREPWIQEFDALIEKDATRCYILVSDTHVRELAEGRCPTFVIEQAKNLVRHLPDDRTLFGDE